MDSFSKSFDATYSSCLDHRYWSLALHMFNWHCYCLFLPVKLLAHNRLWKWDFGEDEWIGSQWLGFEQMQFAPIMFQEVNFILGLSCFVGHICNCLICSVFRHCTDVLCCVIFVLVILGYIALGIVGKYRQAQWTLTCSFESIFSFTKEANVTFS